MAAKPPIADMFSRRRPCEIDQAGDASESGERRATRERPWQRREPWVKSLAIIPAPGSAAAPVPRNVPPQGELQVGVGVLSDRPRPGTLIPALETPEDEFVAAVLVEAGQVNPGQSGRLPHLPTVRQAGQEDTAPSEIFPDAGDGLVHRRPLRMQGDGPGDANAATIQTPRTVGLDRVRR